MLGTSKKPFSAEELHPGLKEASSGISALSLDAEDKFLYMAALSFNYRQCGLSAAKSEAGSFEVAQQEELQYCTPGMLQALRDILHENNDALLGTWLRLCKSAQRIVTPEFIPVLFSQAEKNKLLRSDTIDCCGKRGEWLSRFNPSWNFYRQELSDELWHTGSLEQRKEVLKQLRVADPVKAREWLEQVWPQENANTKAELLKSLLENLSLYDEQWLQSLLKEKSVKVKEETFTLLKQLPGSSLVKAYQDLLQQMLFIKKEKAMLGLLNKLKIEAKMPKELPDIVVASGIDKLSNIKGVSDELFIVAQLLNVVPPSFLESQYGATPEEIVTAFFKETSKIDLNNSLAASTVTYQDKAWASALAKFSGKLYDSVIALLPQKESEAYLMKTFDQHPNDAVWVAAKSKEEWSTEFALFILNGTSQNVYQYGRSFYNPLVSVLPLKLKDQLNSVNVKETYRSSWETVRDHIYNLLTIKEQLLQSFHKL